MGKGDFLRPTDKSKFDINYNRIFRKKKKKKRTFDHIATWLKDTWLP